MRAYDGVSTRVWWTNGKFGTWDEVVRVPVNILKYVHLFRQTETSSAEDDEVIRQHAEFDCVHLCAADDAAVSFRLSISMWWVRT